VNRSEAVIYNQNIKGREFHGMRGTPEYNSWIGMFQRCTNPKHKDFLTYGGRGIVICIRWHRFHNFLKDMGYKPIGYTLDRINGNKDYGPDNCRWATLVEQARNKGIYKNNTSGFNGVKKRSNGKFQACIGINGTVKSLGTFKTFLEAKIARQSAEVVIWK
jgi:hypothetical protein